MALSRASAQVGLIDARRASEPAGRRRRCLSAGGGRAGRSGAGCRPRGSRRVPGLSGRIRARSRAAPEDHLKQVVSEHVTEVIR